MQTFSPRLLQQMNYLFSFEFQFESIHSTHTRNSNESLRAVVTRRSTADAYRITQPALELRRPFLAPSSKDDDDDDDWDDDQTEDDDDDGDRDRDDHAFCVNQSTGWEIDKLMLARVVVVLCGANLHASFHSLAISSLPISIVPDTDADTEASNEMLVLMGLVISQCNSLLRYLNSKQFYLLTIKGGYGGFCFCWLTKWARETTTSISISYIKGTYTTTTNSSIISTNTYSIIIIISYIKGT